MNIGLNAISFVPGKMGGMETYLRNLVHFLQAMDGENRYTLFCDRRYAVELPLDSERFQVRYMNYARPSFKWYLRGMVRNSLNMDILRWEMDARGIDFMHHPFTVLTPLGTGIPAVLTFWDMQHEFFPDFFDRVELQRRRRNYRASAEEAQRIIVSAKFTKDCLVERYAIPADKIDVVYTGYSPQYRVVDNQNRLRQVREQYGLDRPFLYYPAATWPHKNHHTLLAAFRMLVDGCGFDGNLVLTGIAMQSHDGLLTDIKRLGLADRVKVAGYLPEEVLPCIYNLARLMVFPSLFEGFGIPLVEAMACGCPIACADSTSLPEVAADVAVYFDPHSAADMADKIRQVWYDDDALESMGRRSIERAKLFTWRETVRKTMLVYSRVGSEVR